TSINTGAGFNDEGEGKTYEALTKLATFEAWGGAIDDQGGTGAVWRIYDGHTTPLLRTFLAPLNLMPAFDGSGSHLDEIGALADPGLLDDDLVLGELTANTLILTGSDNDGAFF